MLNRSKLEEIGFVGFESIRQLMLSRCIELPAAPGVYVVVRDAVEVEFVEYGSGGQFKGRDPNVPIATLSSRWIPDADIVYFGKAGGEGSKSTLRGRVGQYMRFGQGANIGHWGGRYIWQIKGIGDLRIGWFETQYARAVEAELINQFYFEYEQRPFANLAA